MTSGSAAITRAAVSGGVQLSYDTREKETTRLFHQWARPPLHLGKAYLVDEWAINLLMSPTAGLLSGDSVEVTVDLARGSKAAVISPAACRIHTMEDGYAEVKQTLKVGAGAVLDFWPAPLILQKGSRLKQQTELTVAKDATVLLCEIITPGRAAFGECFEFDNWQSTLKIRRDGRLLAFENFKVEPDSGDAKDWLETAPEGSYASLYCLSPYPLDQIVEQIHTIRIEGAHIGASPLRQGGLGMKILANDGISLRHAILSLRKTLIPALQVPFPQALQRAQTFFN